MYAEQVPANISILTNGLHSLMVASSKSILWMEHIKVLRADLKQIAYKLEVMFQEKGT